MTDITELIKPSFGSQKKSYIRYYDIDQKEQKIFGVKNQVFNLKNLFKNSMKNTKKSQKENK